MFTTTNGAGIVTSAGVGGGPVPPTFQIISTQIPGSSSSSSSTAPPVWRLTSTPSSSSLIKQPSVVSIINGNMNITSSTSAPMTTNGNILYIATNNPSSTSGNLIFQSPQTVRLVSSPLHSSLSAPTFSLLHNSNTTIANTNLRQITTPPSK
jgi:hypothetical protein